MDYGLFLALALNTILAVSAARPVLQLGELAPDNAVELAGHHGQVEVCDDPAGCTAEIVSKAAATAIAQRGAFAIAIAGGSLVQMLGAMKDRPNMQWGKWHVAWVDERCVKHNDTESNYGGAKKAWLDKVPIPAAQIFPIDEAKCNGGGRVMAEAAATEYEARLRSVNETALPRSKDGWPVFDLLLLGFGPDGHVCSLFPERPQLDDNSDRWILPIWDSPKKPPERITLSLAAVNAATRVVLVGTGDGKKEIVRTAFSPGCQLPLCRARGASRKPIWVLDRAAAALLPKDPADKVADADTEASSTTIQTEPSGSGAASGGATLALALGLVAIRCVPALAAA